MHRSSSDVQYLADGTVVLDADGIPVPIAGPGSGGAAAEEAKVAAQASATSAGSAQTSAQSAATSAALAATRAENAEKAKLEVPDTNVSALVGNNSSLTKAALMSGFVDRRGVRGATRTIYVRADGNDTNDGKTVSTAFREIKTAVASLSDDGPVIRGSVVIDVGAGTYKGGIRLPLTRGRSQDDYLKIRGPGVGGHPNTPTAIVDYNSDTTASWGILAESRCSVWLENIKFVGGFSTAVRMDDGPLLEWRNVHVDGGGVAGARGLTLNSRAMYFATGGIVENCATGVEEFFNVVRSYGSSATSNAQQMTIRNCDTGLRAKEGCVGHLDWLNVEDCQTGIELMGMCTANVKGVSLRRNQVGIVVANSQIHNATTVTYGTDADANARNYVAVGSAGSDLTELGWQDGTWARTTRHGYRPLVTVAADHADRTVSGVTAETTFVQLDGVLQPNRYNSAGTRFKVVAWGSVNTAVTTANGFLIRLRIGGVLTSDMRIPQSAVAGEDFRLEFEVVCTADGNTQRVMVHASGLANWAGSYSTRALNMTQPAQPVRISGIPAATTESITLHLVEVWG